MSGYLISARKYRPVNFEDVVGQEIITSALKSSIDNKKLAQALLFTGPRGVGKTSCARIVAREINNFEINDDNSYNIFELDAASNNGVESIRSLIEQTRIPPQKGKYKVYIIDEVHMLSSGAFNAFLKTLEEPPRHCIFILATTEKHKIIPTILSRCQIYNFKRISNDNIANHLKSICEIENIKYQLDGLIEIASKSDGAMRDSLQLFDKIVGLNKEITVELVSENINSVDFNEFKEICDLIIIKDIPNLIVKVNTVLNKGISGDLFLSSLSSFYRNILLCKEKSTQKFLKLNDDRITILSKISDNHNYEILIEFINILNNAEINFQKSLNKRLLVELTLLKITSLNIDEEKKKFNYKLIPISKFSKNSFLKKINTKVKFNSLIKPIANINMTSFKTSALSLKSLQKNKEIKQVDLEDEVVFNNEKNITLKNIIDFWDSYSIIQEEKGRHNIASILRISKPKFKNNIITYTVPNETSALEIKYEKKKLISFLRNKLKSKVELIIDVNKKIDKKIAYSNIDKYQLMKTKNPLIDELKKTFNLSIT